MLLHTTMHLKKLRVLVADDHPDNRDFMLLLLQDIVLKVDMACDGMEALNKLATNNYDVVIMDYHMPNLNGCEATRILRDRECQQRHTAVIGLTADIERGNHARFSAAGMDDHLTKPVMIKDLLGTIMKVTS